jgi:hypothetical protein
MMWMRGSDDRSGSLFSYVDLEQRVPTGHPVRSMADHSGSHPRLNACVVIREPLPASDFCLFSAAPKATMSQKSSFAQPAISDAQALRADRLNMHVQGGRLR